MAEISLIYRLSPDIEEDSIKREIDAFSSDSIVSLKERIFEKVFKEKYFNGFDIDAEDLKLWKVQIDNKEYAFSRLVLKNMEGIKKLKGKVEDFWEAQPSKEITHIIVDLPLLTTLKKIKQLEDEITSDYIIPKGPRPGGKYLKDLYHAKVIRKNDVLQIDKEYNKVYVYIQCKVSNFDDGILSVFLLNHEEQRKEGISLVEDLERWLLEYQLDAMDGLIDHDKAASHIEIIRNGKWIGSIAERRRHYIKNQELKKRYKDSVVKSEEANQDVNLSEVLSRLSIIETKDYDYSVNSESNTVSVFDQYETSDSRSDILSQVYTPEQVRTYLKEFGFDQNDVEKWDQPIEVPNGVDTSLFIAREAIIYGLSFDAINLYPELIDYARGFGGIPNFVTTKYQIVDTSRFVKGGYVHESFPNTLIVIKTQYHRGGFDKMLDLIKGKKNINIRNLLYRGVRSYGVIPDDIAFGFSPNSINNDFGRGLYTTPSIDYAIKHIKDDGRIRIGALMIFDWSDSGGRGLETKHLIGDEWKSTVKAYICINDDNYTKPGPPRFSADILVGAISENNEDVKNCNIPIPLSVKQVVGRTQKGLRAFENRLIAIIYVYS